MKLMFKKLVLVALFSFAFLFIGVQKSEAALYFVEAPASPLTRNLEYDFIITVDTLGTPMTTGIADVTYETQYLQLVSVSNGNFFDSVTHTTPATGTIRLTGTNASAKSGSGNFAIIRFKLIATAAGSTTLCSVEPVTTPTPVPTTPVGPTSPPLLQCSLGCSTNSQCASGLSCIGGMCLNPSCSAETDCICPAPAQCSLSCTTNADCANGLSCIGGMCLNSSCPAEAGCVCPQPTRPLPAQIPREGFADGWRIGSIIALSLIGLGVVGILLL